MTALASLPLSVRLGAILARNGITTLGQLRSATPEQLRALPNFTENCMHEVNHLLTKTPDHRHADICIPDLQDLTYGPRVYFATLKFYSFVTCDGPDRRALTPALEHYARDGWRPVGVWASGRGGTWVEVLLQRENGV